MAVAPRKMRGAARAAGRSDDAIRRCAMPVILSAYRCKQRNCALHKPAEPLVSLGAHRYHEFARWRVSCNFATVRRCSAVLIQLLTEANHGNLYHPREFYGSGDSERQGLAGSARSVQADG